MFMIHGPLPFHLRFYGFTFNGDYCYIFIIFFSWEQIHKLKKYVPTYYKKKFLPSFIQDVAFLRMYRIYIQFKIISMVWE